MTSLTFTTGEAVLVADSQTLRYVITELTAGFATDLGDAANIALFSAAGATGLSNGTEYQTIITAACAAGRYGLILEDSVKVCPVCSAGATGDGNACSSCDAGTSKAAVGSGSCAACDPGTYAASGSSDCLPCPQHTYSGSSAGQCTQW